MGQYWGLIKLNAKGEDTDDSFDAEPWGWDELDLVLVGKAKGPVSKLCASASSEPKVDTKALRKCADELAKIETIPAVSSKKFARECSHSMDLGDEQEVLDEATEAAERLRDFITRAGKRGWHLRFWCG